MNCDCIPPNCPGHGALLSTVKWHYKDKTTSRWSTGGGRTNSSMANKKNPPAVQKTWVQSLGWEGSLTETMATYTSVLAWRIPWTEELGGATVYSVAKSGTRLRNWTYRAFTELWNYSVWYYNGGTVIRHLSKPT